jgi:DNA-binding LytR/AlgR family response regulator
MIKAIAIDDEPLALRIIDNFCAKVDFIQLVKTFTRPAEALEYLRSNPVDLLFLDIQMPSLTGIELYKEVKSTTMVIFTTAFSEYAVEGFNLNAIDYLLKPFTMERFLQAVQKALKEFNYQKSPDTKEAPPLLIKADYSIIKVEIADIIFIEGLDDYLKIHLTNRKPLVTRMTMKGILEMLPANFARVHRSFIVPIDKIKSVRNKTIFISESTEIPIGNSYEEQFLKIFRGQNS